MIEMAKTMTKKFHIRPAGGLRPYCAARGGITQSIPATRETPDEWLCQRCVRLLTKELRSREVVRRGQP